MRFRSKSRQQAAPAGETGRVAKLRAAIEESRRLRPLMQDPDRIAVIVERTTTHTVRGLWFFLALGLVFTTTGVQDFLAGNATPADPVWWGAWTVEPMFAGLLILLLNFEALILSYGVDPAAVWWTRLKRILLGSTLFMNVAPQIRIDGFEPGSFAVHAIIPVIVFALAEVIPVIHARSHQVIADAYARADQAVSKGIDDTDEHSPQEAPAATPAPPEEPEADHATERPTEPPTPVKPDTAVHAVQQGPKLPPPMAQAVTDAYQQAASQGRRFTPADVQRVISVSDQVADQIARSYAPVNDPVTT